MTRPPRKRLACLPTAPRSVSLRTEQKVDQAQVDGGYDSEYNSRANRNGSSEQQTCSSMRTSAAGGSEVAAARRREGMDSTAKATPAAAPMVDSSKSLEDELPQ